jgi:chromate transport protein ChrA
MKDLVSFTYDFFGHVLPGLLVLISLSLLYVDVTNYKELVQLTESINTGIGTVLVIASYIIGFAINPFGRYVYRTLGFKIWPKKENNPFKMAVSDKFALIREDSPKNFEYIERWNTYCAMSHNLSIASLVLALVTAYKMITDAFNMKLWLPLFLLAVFLFFVLVHRAVVFSIWAKDDVNAALLRLKQQEENSEA